MKRQEAERITTEYLKPVYGFALKRCKSLQDAEDLSQEIILKAFRALIAKDDIADPAKFIWAIAHNTLSNYYRDSARTFVGVPIDEIGELASDEETNEDNSETFEKLRSEIAYLSKLQRKIVIAYYFEKKKQADIAKALNIPLGTVKWHLFEAKKELKRGIDTVRQTSDLKFNPIKFHSAGINGSVGTKGAELLRSTLSQNICYCVRNTAKTVNEIADDLGVSPVYVETEVEYLENYGLLTVQKNRYILNFIISEPTAELLTLQDKMYKEAAGLFANDLYEELISSGILEDDGIICNQFDGEPKLEYRTDTDKNFELWTLIPYIAAWSGEDLTDERIAFEEVATYRPDGGHNIYHASVVSDDIVLPEDYVYMKNWCGPMWNGEGGKMLWQINSQWSDRENIFNSSYEENARRILSLFKREDREVLSKDEYAWLCEKGYVKTCGDPNGYFQSTWQLVYLEGDVKDRLLEMGRKIKEKYLKEFEELKKPYAKAALDAVPGHLRKIKEYELQFTFHSDSWFLFHCITTLLANGKLKEPTEEQRKTLTTLICDM